MSKGSFYGESSECLNFQNDLHSLLEWSEKWQLKLNINTCCVSHIGTTHEQTNYFMYKDNYKKLKCTNSAKDVGVTINEILKSKTHIIANVANKASQLRGLIIQF